MADKHTPGEWRACPSGQIVAGPLSHQIARIWNTKNREADEANARLIAAAPELLAALRGMIYGAGACAVPHEGERKALQMAVDQALAVIEKVRGEQ